MAMFRNLPLWLSALVWAFLPYTFTPQIEILSIPVESKDCLIWILFLYYGIVFLFFANPENALHTKSVYLNLPAYVSALGFYAAISMLWSTCEGKDRIAMAYTMANTVLTFFAAYFIVAGKSNLDVARLVDRLVWFVSIVGVVYFSESYFSIGLRSTEGRDAAIGEFGIQRVHGPLFGAACGYFLLLPAIGITLDKICVNMNRFALDLAVLLALIITLVGMGSRGANIGLGILCVMFLLTCREQGKRVFLIILLFILLAGSMLLVYSKASSEKVSSFEDTPREDNYKAALSIVSSSGLRCLYGSGYGSVWAWYLPDVEDGGALATKRFYVPTKYGIMLYNPHSILLMLVVELGVIGVVFFVKLIQLPILLLIRSSISGQGTGMASAMLASSVAYVLDFPIFKYWAMALLWWIFVLVTLRGLCNENVR